MTKNLQNPKSLVAHSVAGTPIKIPEDLNEEQVDEFLAQFSLDDQIDIFCVTEALLMSYERQQVENAIRRSVNMVSTFLQLRANQSPMAELLEKRHLILSTQRLLLGRELCIYNLP